MAIRTKEQTEQRAEVAPEPTAAHSTREIWLDIAVLATACVVFFALCVYQLPLPGLYNDEAFDVIPAMQMLLGHPVELQRNAGIHILGLTLPLMSSSDYQGVTSTYLALPFLAIGGVNAVSLRLMTVTVGLLGIVLAYFLARAWFGRAEARLTVLMLATSPAWIFWSRLGVYVVSEVVPIATASLLAFTYWLRARPLGRHNRGLYIGMFFLGLGLTTKLLFLWFIVAAILTGAIMFGSRVWEHRQHWWGNLARLARIGSLSLLSFCAGAFPFLLYNVMTRGTWNLLKGSLSNLGATSHGVNNTAFVRNLWTEADSLKIVLDGGYFWFQGVAAKTYSNPLTPALFGIAALGLIAMVLPRPSGTSKVAAWQRAGFGLTGVGAIIAVLLAMGLLSGGISAVTILASIAAGLLGIALSVVSAFRRGSGAHTEWFLGAVAAIMGTLWWFAGAGRPETHSPNGPLGLWPVDAAGILFWAAGAGLAVVLGADRATSSYARASLATLVLIGLIVAQSAVTISGLWSTHLIVLIPLPQMLIAAFVVTAGRKLAETVRLHRAGAGARLARVAPAVLVVGSILVADLGVDYSYHRDLALGGGRSTFSDAIYDVSSYLENIESHPTVVAMDWGFKRPIQFLTGEAVNPLEAYGYSAEPTPEFHAGLRNLLKDPNTVYLFHDPSETAYPRFDAFTQEAGAAGKAVTLDKTFSTRDGAIVYRLYTAK